LKKLERIIAALDRAGTSPTSADVLDALWLASQERQISIYAAEAPQPAPKPSPLAKKKNPPRDDSKEPVKENAEPAPDESPVYPSVTNTAGGPSAKAAPVSLPGGQGLRDRLAFMRALRPFRQPWLSTSEVEIDEVRTVEETAEAGSQVGLVVKPAFRPLRQRWYDVHVVAEDDPLIDVWDDTVAQFCAVLRDTGAFGRVQSWSLQLSASEDFEEVDRETIPMLESPTGRRIPGRDLVGDGRRALILFVTHGSSTFWRDASYAKVLAHWYREASVAILQLLPRERWPYTYLGDLHGLCFTEDAGAVADRLKAEPFWWAAPEDDPSRLIRIPLVSLRPSEMADWAAMQMGRGRRSPFLFLDPIARDGQVAPSDNTSERNFDRAIGQLREVSPQAFRLATFLAPSNFTIPVARLIQEAKFGSSADPSHLGELFLSGLVFAKAQSRDGPIGDRYFGFWPEAREILLRSLRYDDAAWVSSEIYRELSKYIGDAAGDPEKVKAYIKQRDGQHEIPDWVTPFAEVAASHDGVSEGTTTIAQALEEFLADMKLSSEQVEYLAQLATRDHFELDSRIMSEMAARKLIEPRGRDYTWAPGVQQQLLRYTAHLLTPHRRPPQYRSPEAIRDPREPKPTPRVSVASWGNRNLMRIYRRGYGECELLSLEGRSGRPYLMLVNLGRMVGTASRGPFLTDIALNIAEAKHLDCIVVTANRSGKMGGFPIAERIWRRFNIDELLLGWWEDPHNPLAHKVYRPNGPSLEQAKNSLKKLAKQTRYLSPRYPPLQLGDTGAHFYMLGAPEDQAIIRRYSEGGPPCLDFAVELATGEVLLFATSYQPVIWEIWSQLSWKVGADVRSGHDLLSRTVFLRTRLLGDDVQVLLSRALPLMPKLRFVSAPSDDDFVKSRRWKSPPLAAISMLAQMLEGRGGALLIDGVSAFPDEVQDTDFYFDVSYPSAYTHPKPPRKKVKKAAMKKKRK
jgi:hypothetical protein